MSLTSGRLFRAIEYRSRLRQLSPSGEQHAAYLSEHPDGLAARLDGLGVLENEIASADLEGCDREALLAEAKSYMQALRANGKGSGNIFGALRPTWRDALVAAASAYITWKGRGWLEGKSEEFARKQAAYVAEELKRG